MYIPAVNKVESWDQKQKLIRDCPLGTVITTDADGKFIANHFPFFLYEDEVTGKKYLQAHVARKNHQVPSLTANENVLVIFQTPESYISPSYYPEKEKTHKFVPTWDFGSLHVYGKLRIIDDFDFVRQQLQHFSYQQELKRERPWLLSDAPESYLNTMQKAIIGLEIEIVDSECKFKFEQNMSRENIDGVHNGLVEDGIVDVAEYVKKCNHSK